MPTPRKAPKPAAPTTPAPAPVPDRSEAAALPATLSDFEVFRLARTMAGELQRPTDPGDLARAARRVQDTLTALLDVMATLKDQAAGK